MKLEIPLGVLGDEIRDLYSAESQAVEILEAMVKAAWEEIVRAALDEELEQARTSLTKLQEVMDLLGIAKPIKACFAIRGLAIEAESRMETTECSNARDIRLVCIVQRMNNYKAVGYGIAHSIALMLDFQEVSQLLQAILDENAPAEIKLSDLAQFIDIDSGDGLEILVG